MTPNPFLGVILHAIGGFAAGSFYIPFKSVRRWSWESYWLVGGVFSWIIAPWTAAVLIVPNLRQVLAGAPLDSLMWTYLFGVLWGIGGLTFGLSMRYLGLSLGYALALGFCAAFGTIVPPAFSGEIVKLARALSGQITLGGVLVCLLGIAICGMAGMRKEKELPANEKTATIREFNFKTGLWVAIFAGLMSACMAFAFAAGKPIGALAIERGTPHLWQNLPILVVVLLGGFTTNFIWCIYLNLRNRSLRDYVDGGGSTALGNLSGLAWNYFFAASAGITWYLQFFFFGMGKTKMGRYDFSSWTIHMAFIIVFSNLWGIWFHEWRGVGRPTMARVWTGVAVLVLSTIVIGLGNYLAG